MFTGFSMKYPEYSVICPQSKTEVTVRTLTVQEEERLRGSFVTPVKLTDHLNRCIYDCIVDKPEIYGTYENFLKNTTVKDREALLYGIFHVSYDEIRHYDVKCDKPNCEAEYSVSINISSTFNVNPYPDDDIFTKIIPVQLPVLKNVTAFIKQPTLFDENYAIKSFYKRPDVTPDSINSTLIIDRFEVDDTNSKTPIIYNDRIDIMDAYQQLSTRDRRKIYKTYYDNFGMYKIDLKMKTFCSKCGEEQEININVVDQFFRMVFSTGEDE